MTTNIAAGDYTNGQFATMCDLVLTTVLIENAVICLLLDSLTIILTLGHGAGTGQFLQCRQGLSSPCMLSAVA